MSVDCPQCHSKVTLEGSIYNQIDYVDPPASFRPNSFPFYAIFFTNVPLENKFFACSFCGLIWTKASSDKLRSFGTRKEAI